MAPTTLTPASTVSPPSNTNSPDNQYRIVRKRNRVPLSCAPCRHRKLKCNRGHPCDNCSRRGDVDSCTYAAPSNRKKAAQSPSSTTPDEMQNRIDRLEGLVLSLMTNGPQSAGPVAAVAALAQTKSTPASDMSRISSNLTIDTGDSNHDDMEEDMDDRDDRDVDHVAKSIGVMKVDGGKNMFISEAHWFSILAEISEVKNYFMENRKSFEDSIKKVNASKDLGSAGGGLFFLNAPPATRAEIYKSFPSKATTDKLIARFFTIYNYDPSFQIIHGPTYQKQYDKHWLALQETDAIWLGLTYSMMMIALASYQRNGDEPEEYRGRTLQMYRDYKRLTAQTLNLLDIGQPIPYMLETLVLYAAADIGIAKDAETGTLLGVTVIVRLAMKMGYHRDSKFFPDVTPYQGEMRRRMWAMVRQSDLRVAAQFGLPPMIRTDVSNTEAPRNLYDDELSEDLKVLPPSRPPTEATPIGFIVYRSRLTDIGYEIVEEVQKMGTTNYEVVMKLDAKLREVHDAIPPHLKLRPLGDYNCQDRSSLGIKAFILEIEYLKLVCYLHRKFSSCARDIYSKRSSVDSAMEILRLQAILVAEQRPDGRLSEAKFFMCSLVNHDFLLAAMIVSMDLYRTIEAEKTGQSPPENLENSNSKSAKVAALEQALHMWEQVKEESYDALKATSMLTAMLIMLHERESQLQTKRSSFAQTTNPQVNGPPNNDNKLAPEHSAAMTLGMLSSGGSLNSAAPNSYATPVGNNLFDQSQQMAQASMAQQYMAASATDTSNIGTAVNPFSSLFGGGGNFQQMDQLSQNLDWVRIASRSRSLRLTNF